MTKDKPTYGRVSWIIIKSLFMMHSNSFSSFNLFINSRALTERINNEAYFDMLLMVF